MATDIKQKVLFELQVNGISEAKSGMKGFGDSADKAANGLKNTTLASSQAADGLGSLVIKFVSIAAAIAVAKRAVGFFTDSVMAAVDAGEAYNKFQVVFGDMADSTNARLEELATNTNNSIYGLRDLTGGLQDLLVPMLDDRDAAAELSVKITELALDLASFQDKDVADVTNALTSGFLGQSRAVAGLGIEMKVATVNAELLAMGVDGTTLTAEAGEIAQARYNIMLRDSADAIGDAARTADEAQGSLRGLRVMWEDGAVTVGEYFIPVIEELVPLLKEDLADVLPILQKIAERIANDMLEYGPMTIKTLGLVVDAVGFLVGSYDALEQAARIAAGPGVYFLSEAIDFFTERAMESDETASRFGDTLKALGDRVIRNRQENYEYAASIKGITAEQIELNQQIGKAINLYQMDTAAKVEMATATSNAAIAELRLLDAVMGGFGVFDTQITEIEMYVGKLNYLAKTMDEGMFIPPETVPTQGRVPPPPPPPPRPVVTGADPFAILGFGSLGDVESTYQEITMIAVNEEELKQEAIASIQADWREQYYDTYMQFSGDVVNTFVDSWANGFEDLDDMMKKMIERWMKEMVASGILTLFSQAAGGGAVGLFGTLLGKASGGGK